MCVTRLPQSPRTRRLLALGSSLSSRKRAPSHRCDFPECPECHCAYPSHFQGCYRVPCRRRRPIAEGGKLTFRLGRTVEGDGLANERLEGGLVNFFSFVDVDRAAYVSVETRVEETGRILQRRALGEGELHDILVGFASADDAVVRPNRRAHPLPLLDDVRVCFLDELAHPVEGFPAPVREFGDSVRDELRCRLALARARLFHVLIPKVSGISIPLTPTGGREQAGGCGCPASTGRPRRAFLRPTESPPAPCLRSANAWPPRRRDSPSSRLWRGQTFAGQGRAPPRRIPQ